MGRSSAALATPPPLNLPAGIGSTQPYGARSGPLGPGQVARAYFGKSNYIGLHYFAADGCHTSGGRVSLQPPTAPPPLVPVPRLGNTSKRPEEC